MTLDILVAEDEPTLRKLLAMRIQHVVKDSKVEAVENGTLLLKKAMERVISQPYDAIVTDNDMPGGPLGKDAVKELRSKGYQGPIFIVSGGSLTEQEALAAGANEFIFKDPGRYMQTVADRLVQYLVR